jgi:hypothetical protein
VAVPAAIGDRSAARASATLMGVGVDDVQRHDLVASGKLGSRGSAVKP